MKLLVCGGRKYKDYKTLCKVLDNLHKERPITLLIQGEALGADKLAKSWAVSRGIPTTNEFHAKWKEFGNAAGPIRNREMLDKGKPDAILAFEGGSGTADMVSAANAAGVERINKDDFF